MPRYAPVVMSSRRNASCGEGPNSPDFFGEDATPWRCVCGRARNGASMRRVEAIGEFYYRITGPDTIMCTRSGCTGQFVRGGG